IIDTQSEADFKTGHIKGAIATNAEMLENDTQKAQMDIVAEQAASAAKPIVIVSNDGGLSAENAHKYLVEKGIKTEQIFILEKGQKGWTFADLTEKTL
ncbi:MAG: rhodanese-like domain-containing protein, partial [Clostridiales bacterium]